MEGTVVGVCVEGNLVGDVVGDVEGVEVGHESVGLKLGDTVGIE